MALRRAGPLKTPPLIDIHLGELKVCYGLILSTNSNQGQNMEKPKNIALLMQR
jgi:hypothetical protein